MQAGAKALPGKSTGGLLSARGVFDRAADEFSLRSAVKDLVDKVDMADINNPQANLPYMADIHRHYREAEVCHCPAAPAPRAARTPGSRGCRSAAAPVPCDPSHNRRPRAPPGPRLTGATPPCVTRRL